MDKQKQIEQFFAKQKELYAKLEAPSGFEDIVYKAAQKAQLSPRGGKSLLGRFFRQKRNRFLTGFAAIAVIACFALLSFLPGESNLPRAIRGLVEIKAAAAYSCGIDPAKGFIITSEEPLSTDLIKENLILSPTFDYTLKEAKGGTEYYLLPAEPLNENTVYKLSFGGENHLSNLPELSWAFQTVPSFVLEEAIPRDTSSGVPVEAGIELVFSQPPGDDALKAITIEPRLEGEWQQNKNTLVFVPKNPLAYATLYTLVIPAGIQNKDANASLEQESIIRFETQSADRGNSPIYFWGENNSFSPEEIPFFSYYGGRDNRGLIMVSVYQYPNSQGYLEDLQNRMGEYFWCEASGMRGIETNKLTQIMDFEIKREELSEYDSYLYLPEPLPAGYYAAAFKNEEDIQYLLFQVTEISAYLGYGADQSILWLNNLATGLPVAGAEIEIISGGSFISDADGIALMNTDPKRESHDIYFITKDDESLILAANYYFGYNYEANKFRQAYWNYLYVDRELYRPGDTLNYFGILSSREDEYKELKEAELVLEGYNIFGGPGLKKALKIEGGVFEGNLELPWLTPGYYSLALYAGGNYINSAYFEVAAYTKPAYKLTMESKEKVIMAWDSLNIEIQSSFFEGTPLPNTEFTLYGRGIEGNKKLKTDSKGKGDFKTNIPQGTSYALLDSAYFSAEAILPEAGRIEASFSILVFNSDIQLRAKVKRQQNTALIDAEAFAVDINKIQDYTGNLEEEARINLKGALNIEAVLRRHEWDKKESGSYYNPYTKQVEPRYYYDLRYEEEASFPLVIGSGGELSTSLPLGDENAYSLTLKAKDTKGREMVREYYIPALKSVGDFNSYRYLSIQTPDYRNAFAPGETVNTTLKWGEENLNAEKGNVLIFRSRKEILDYHVQKSGNYSYDFLEEYIPNINLAAVYFDGRTYYAAQTTHIIDKENKKPQVLIEADKESYGPGQNVKLKVDLKDKDGNPLEGYINLNLVDEALLALRDQYVNIADRLFGNLYSNYFYTLISHISQDNMDGAEQGGEGDGAREDFRDTALFTTVKTDKNGKGEIEFTLPDNITSWRLIWQAYAPGIWADSGSQSIDATLPFFADCRREESYLAGDAPVLALRSAGLALSENAQIEYTLKIPQLNYEESNSGPSYAWTDFPLPELTAGEYEVFINAKWGEYEDNIKTSFKVINSHISHTRQIQELLRPGLIPQGAKEAGNSLINLFFSDEKQNLALQGLYNLAAQDDIRLEQRLAAHLAKKLLAENFEIGDIPGPEEERAWKEQLFKYQADNGLAILPYSGANLEASVLAASFAGESLAKEGLILYFQNTLKQARAGDTPDYTQASFSLWGLAALSQPVLNQIQQLLALPEIGAENRLNLIIALYFAGDGANAGALAAPFTEQWAEPVNNLFRAKIDGDRQEVLKATARLALLANIFNLPQGDGLYEYILENTSEEDYFLLEKLGILQARLARPIEDTSFEYILNGEKNQVDLSENGYYALTLLAEDLPKIEFKNIKGAITLTTIFKEEGLPEANPASSALNIERQYPSDEELNQNLAQRGRVGINLSFSISEDAPDGYYKIVEYLPAGLSYVALNFTSDNVWLIQAGDKELHFAVYKEKNAALGKIKYFARASAEGSFKAEPPSLTHGKHFNTYAQGEEDRVFIKY